MSARLPTTLDDAMAHIEALTKEVERLRTVVTAAKKLRAALSSGSNIAVERGFDAALAVLSSGEQTP